MQPIKARASSVVANAESPAETGRRQMLAGAIGLAGAVSNRAALAEDKFDRVFGGGSTGETLPKAGDFTAYNKVQVKKGFVPSSISETKPEEVGMTKVEPLAVPAVVLFTGAVTAAVPAFLSAG